MSSRTFFFFLRIEQAEGKKEESTHVTTSSLTEKVPIPFFLFEWQPDIDTNGIVMTFFYKSQ